MKAGDKVIYIGKSTGSYKKYSVGKLICIYEDSSIIVVYMPETNTSYDIYDDERVYMRDKKLFCTLKEYRKQKLEKINLL
jgi:hypothetical protein